MRRALRGLLAMAAALTAALVLAACDDGSPEAVTVTVGAPPPAMASPKAPAQPARGSGSAAARPRGHRGPFSSHDGLQRCRAEASAVTCLSTVSGQEVMLRREGVDYLGTTWAEPAPAAPLAMGRGIRTAGGIRCLSSTRGIECSRGRFGFVIGDRSVVVIRDGVETRFSGSEPPPPPPAPPPPPPDPLPTPAPVAPDPGYVGSGTEWIQEVSRDGAFIVLSDGSVWEVVGHHRYRSTLWLITHDVVVLDDGYFHRLVNLDRDDSVDARFLGYR